MRDTKTVVDQFQAAFQQRAPDQLTDLVAEDCVMEGVGPAPDGNRWTGSDECLAGWRQMMADTTVSFENERVDIGGDLAVIRWRLPGADPFRGVTILRVRDGKIVEALGYGKRPTFVTEPADASA